jgi:uncharacterized repeat protein (TIGR02543 family)
VTDATGYESGSTATVADNEFTRAGYTFTGWNTRADGSGTAYAASASLTVTGNVTLYAQWGSNETPPVDTPVPSAPDSLASVVVGTSDATRGEARLARGQDAYTVTVTVHDAEGDPVSGVADQLSVTVPQGVTAGTIVDNGDGTYSVPITSTVAGTQSVSVLLDGVAVGSPMGLRFIDSTVDKTTVVRGESLVVTGTGFVPGEQVELSVYFAHDGERPRLGSLTADENGAVTGTVPTGDAMPAGGYGVVLIGATSGTVMANFTVTDPADPGTPTDPGTPIPGGPVVPVAPALPMIDTVTSSVISGTAEPGVTLVLTYAKAGGAAGTLEVLVAADGTWSVETPADAVSGKVTVSVKGASGSASATRDLSVAKVVATTGGAVTPSDSTGLMTLLVGLGLAGLGVVALKVRRHA